MASIQLQKRTFLPTVPPFLATPPTVAELGQIVLSANAAQRGVYIATADDVTGLNPIWHQIDGGGAAITVSQAIPIDAGGTTVEDDIDAFDFTGGGFPTDTGEPAMAAMVLGYNYYFICARDGATYLWGGLLDVSIGNSGAGTPTLPYQALAPTDLIPFGSNPDGMVQNPAAGDSQSITPGAVGDIALTLTPMAGQTANLLDMPGIAFNQDGMMRAAQGAAGSAEIITMEQFIGAAPLLTAHSRGTPGTDLVVLDIQANPLGDATPVERAVLSGDPTNFMVIDNAVTDGGVFT